LVDSEDPAKFTLQSSSRRVQSVADAAKGLSGRKEFFRFADGGSLSLLRYKNWKIKNEN